MSRQIGSLHRSKFHPANLQNPIPIIPLFAFPPPDLAHMNTSSGMNSDTNSDITVFQTISQFINSDIETPADFADSEPSPSTYTQTNDHRSNSHPANLQNPIPVIPIFAFPPLDSPKIYTSSGINSDTNSDITVFQTISQLINSDIETPADFADSEPSPSTYTQTNSSNFSKPPF